MRYPEYGFHSCLAGVAFQIWSVGLGQVLLIGLEPTWKWSLPFYQHPATKQYHILWLSKPWCSWQHTLENFISPTKSSEKINTAINVPCTLLFHIYILVTALPLMLSASKFLVPNSRHWFTTSFLQPLRCINMLTATVIIITWCLLTSRWELL